MNKESEFLHLLNEWAVVINRKNFESFGTTIKKEGLSISQVNTLFYLRYKGTATVGKLAEKLGITNAATSQMLEDLYLKGYISRTEDTHDRRVKKIEITKSGLEFMQNTAENRTNWLALIDQSIPVEEKPSLEKALTLLIEKANSLEEGK